MGDLGFPARYEPVRRIGRGGMSSVWCAEDTVLGRQVAIKLLSGALGEDPAARRRFEREARAVARLSSHPHVITIFDVGETAGPEPHPFIVMEYMAGGTVADELRRGHVHRERALRWLTEAAAALDYAHSRDVIHRDVKPANLLLDVNAALHVGDFGIARMSTEDTITSHGELFGTAAYLSPEQARGEPATSASDRYALAVVAFELLTGRRPFLGETFTAQARQHIEATPPRASELEPSLPEAVDVVLGRGLAKDPGARWPTCEALAGALAEALDTPRRQVAAAAAVPPTIAFGSSRTPSGGARPREPRPAGGWAPAVTHRGARTAAGAALLAGIVLAIAIIAAAGGGSSPKPARATTSAHRVLPRGGNRRRATTVAPATSPSASATTTATTPPAHGSADALEAQGHGLLAGGNPAGAVPILRQAVAAAPPGSLTYAYALFDLGQALRLSGDPAAAIPILEQRLAIPNQTDVVRAELALAQRAAGQATGGGSGAPAPGAGHDNHGQGGGKGHGHGGGGGDGGD